MDVRQKKKKKFIASSGGHCLCIRNYSRTQNIIYIGGYSIKILGRMVPKERKLPFKFL